MLLSSPAETSVPQHLPGSGAHECRAEQAPPNKKTTMGAFFKKKKTVSVPPSHQPEAMKIETELATHLRPIQMPIHFSGDHETKLSKAK